MPSERRASNESESEYDQLGKKILKIDRAILSLTINDDKGEVFGKAFTKEYERKYMDAAKDLRSRAGLFSALIFGIAAEPEKVFGQTKAIVRMYSDVKLILIPFSNRKLMATLLTKNRADSDQLIKEVSPLLEVL
ncbi:MAG TPA: hypothetical protein VED17_01815 [Nitrososphaerales archaeon]|nr:hypothetical protein [Nitrososphaerales archaeon]